MMELIRLSELYSAKLILNVYVYQDKLLHIIKQICSKLTSNFKLTRDSYLQFFFIIFYF